MDRQAARKQDIADELKAILTGIKFTFIVNQLIGNNFYAPILTSMPNLYPESPVIREFIFKLP